MKQLSLKRGFCLMLSVVVSCFFMLVFFCNLSHNSSLSVSASGSGHTRVDAADEDDEETSSFWSNLSGILSAAYHDPDDFFTSFFYLSLNSIGAVFDSETTVSSIRQQWYEIYGNADGYTIDEMKEIFYYGSDGNLYFTDEYLENFYDLVDSQTFQLGVVTVPCNYSDEAYSQPIGLGILSVTSTVNSCINGKDIRVVRFYSPSTSYFDLGFSILGYYPVIYFSTYSKYTTFCSHSSVFSGATSRYNSYTLSLYDSDLNLYSLPSASLLYSVGSFDSSTQTYLANESSAFTAGSSSWSVYASGGYYSSSVYPYFMGSGVFTVYTSYDWLEYYVNGGTGVYYDDSGAAYNAISENALLADNESLYNALMASYKELAAEVADGNLTLEEISEQLSSEISETLDEISQETAAQTTYLKSIVDYCSKIYSSLSSLVALSTVDTVADTVTALTSLVGAAEDFVDDIVDDVLDGTFDTVLEALIESEYYTDLLSSFNSAFPFSLPYDFFLIVNLLAHDPITPEITWRMKFDSIGFDEVYSYDFSAFDSLASVTRVFSSLLFIIALIKITMRLRKKE